MGHLLIFETENNLESITTEDAIKRGLVPEGKPMIFYSEAKQNFLVSDYQIQVHHGHKEGVILVSSRYIPKDAVAYVAGLIATPGITVEAGLGFIPLQFYRKPEISKKE